MLPTPPPPPPPPLNSNPTSDRNECSLPTIHAEPVVADLFTNTAVRVAHRNSTTALRQAAPIHSNTIQSCPIIQSDTGRRHASPRLAISSGPDHARVRDTNLQHAPYIVKYPNALDYDFISVTLARPSPPLQVSCLEHWPRPVQSCPAALACRVPAPPALCNSPSSPSAPNPPPRPLDCSMSVRDSHTATTSARPGPLTGYRDSTLSLFALLLAFRIVNALTLRTFFQPDEFFQSLEPAWQLAFGPNAHACITWVNAHTHTCCPSLCLTLFAGVGRSIALVPAPRPVRCHLPSGRRAGRSLWLDPICSSRPTAGCPKTYPGRICSIAGLLHLEACRKSLRSC